MENNNIIKENQMNSKKRNTEKMELSSTGFGFVPEANDDKRGSEKRLNDWED
ncbi:MAG: hypothetical protein LPK26_03715 [Bacillaceae bacterium]|nr:hypothetical protein [Bacillaceae bacterium]